MQVASSVVLEVGVTCGPIQCRLMLSARTLLHTVPTTIATAIFRAGLVAIGINPMLGSIIGVGGLELAAEALTCVGSIQLSSFRVRTSVNARSGFAPDDELTAVAEMLWTRWLPYASTQQELAAPGSLTLARALVGDGDDDNHQGYCLPAHVAAGFFVARAMHLNYVHIVGGPDSEVAFPREVLSEMDDILIKTLMLFGHNRQLDFVKVAGWAVGAAEVHELRDAMSRACPSAEVPDGDVIVCSVASIEQEVMRGLAATGPLIAHTEIETQSWCSTRRPFTQGGCLARAEKGLPPCDVRVWYLGTHEALFREVLDMWSRFSDAFRFDFARVNHQGIYSPADQLESKLLWAAVGPQSTESKGFDPRSLRFRYVTEDILDVQPAAMRLRGLAFGRHDTTLDGGQFDATICLCTIPALACSAFLGLAWPIIMYAANPATAQVPSTQFHAWLALLADLAADPKNQMLVSNPWSQAQYEYQTGVLFPVIRVHGLYTRVRRRADAGTSGDGARMDQVLVYDRSSSLFARALQVLNANIYGSAMAAPVVPRFVHHAETDRKYETFVSFRAVVFIPGDVEQMAFYEFYSMEIPIFVPSDPGRYMWPRLPGSFVDTACGDYVSWAGVWEIHQQNGHQETYSIDCKGHVDVAGVGSGNLQPLDQMDERGFTHCLEGLQNYSYVRLRLQRDQLQTFHLAKPVSCSGRLPIRKGYLAEGTRTTAEPPLMTMWDHDIFASSVWYLDARLPGAQRVRHSPFSLTNHAAVNEWSKMMDYFRFPAVGLFAHAAELVVALGTESGLKGAVREMRAFNERSLRESTEQWSIVLHAAVP